MLTARQSHTHTGLCSLLINSCCTSHFCRNHRCQWIKFYVSEPRATYDECSKRRGHNVELCSRRVGRTPSVRREANLATRMRLIVASLRFDWFERVPPIQYTNRTRLSDTILAAHNNAIDGVSSGEGVRAIRFTAR